MTGIVDQNASQSPVRMAEACYCQGLVGLCIGVMPNDPPGIALLITAGCQWAVSVGRLHNALLTIARGLRGRGGEPIGERVQIRLQQLATRPCRYVIDQRHGGM